MAKVTRIVYCPHCNVDAEVQKKGMSGDLQRLLCKNCNKTFYAEPVGDDTFIKPRPTKYADPVIDTQTKGKSTKGKPKKEKPIKEKPKKEQVITKILVNSTLIKEIESEIDTDSALEMVKPYFEDVARQNVKVTKNKNEIIYNFKIQTGTKG